MNHDPAIRPADDDSQAAERDAAKRLEGEFTRWQDELLGMLYYLVGNQEDAADALQETFIKCWRNRGKIGEIENLRAWIFRVALNAGRDQRTTAWRRHRRSLGEREATLVAGHDRSSQSGSTQCGSTQGSVEADAMHREQLAIVRKALLQLRPEEQEIFLLRQNGDMTYRQIAESTSLPVGTVKTRMRLALSKLREALEGKM